MAAKRVIINRNLDLCAVARAKNAKLERDQERADTLASLDHHNHSQLQRAHELKTINLIIAAP